VVSRSGSAGNAIAHGRARTWQKRLVAIGCALAAACGGEASRTPTTHTGVASWYGPGFHGRKTTSGEVYDQNGHTAAHKSWPLGTQVRVTNLDNGRTTEVRINDRGPFVSGREIDLSYAAARELDMIGPGTCNVKLEPLLASGENLAMVRFAVQVAAFSDEIRARDLRDRLAAFAVRRGDSASGMNAYLAPAESSVGRVYRVRLGPYPARADADHSAAELAHVGFEPVVVEETVSRP
jgi:rare lipoprotein A